MHSGLVPFCERLTTLWQSLLRAEKDAEGSSVPSLKSLEFRCVQNGPPVQVHRYWLMPNANGNSCRHRVFYSLLMNSHCIVKRVNQRRC
jgi:hypothetical protein